MSDALVHLLPEYLARQRWYPSPNPPEKVLVVERTDGLGGADLVHLVVEADGDRYQLLLGSSEGDAMPPFLHGHEALVVGVVDGRLCYDALLDPTLAVAWLSVVAPGQTAERARPIGVEQSNTSVVFDDRIIAKLFRHLATDTNLDVEVTESLAGIGFRHIARPVGVWRSGGTDLAFAQEFLVDGFEGWQLALTSLRDLYREQLAPGECGADFAGEAERLGKATAELHLAMAEAFGTEAGEPEVWVSGFGPRPFPELEAVVEDLRAVPDPGRAIRVHGDYHLGQTMRTESGWYILDFEGEPARSIEERRRRTSPLKDVAGMLRSFHYATAVAMSEQAEVEREPLAPLAAAWEERNRTAFLAGYLAAEGIGALLPGDERSRQVVLDGFELEKAIYELAYEQAYRPDWVPIPTEALQRLVKTKTIS